MSKDEHDATRFMDGLREQWGEAAKNASSMWHDLNREWATRYRDFLDKQLGDESVRNAEHEWAEGMAKLLSESLESRREARAKFLESQRSMVDGYMQLLDRMKGEAAAE